MNEREELEVDFLLDYLTVREFDVKDQLVISSMLMAKLFEELDYRLCDVKEILESILFAYREATKRDL